MREGERVPCDQVIARLWEYLDGDLEGGNVEPLQRHLELCARCFPEYDFRQAYLRFMRSCARQQVPAELRHRIFQALLEEERLERGGEARTEEEGDGEEDQSAWGRMERGLRRLLGG